MKILYISKLDGRPWVGPTYSVPKQIEAQSKIDTVLWYNVIDYGFKEGLNNIIKWRQLPYYTDLLAHTKESITALPKPFNKPDLIVVEQCYPILKDKVLRKDIMTCGIPYIVVPRGEFTREAQSKKKLKKIFGNIILHFRSFIKKAIAVQCLTIHEKDGTNSNLNNDLFVVPNGVIIPSIKKQFTKHDKLILSFIGRLEPVQKGIDILFEACLQIKDFLTENNCIIDMYGAYDVNVLQQLKVFVCNNRLDNLIKFHEPVYGKEKEAILCNTDVFLIPSRFEGHPTGLLEALAYGIPVVATVGTNMCEEIDKYDAGWTAQNNVESLKNALLKMLNERNSFPLKSANAFELAKKYDWNHIAEISHEQYLRVLSKREVK